MTVPGTRISRRFLNPLLLVFLPLLGPGCAAHRRVAAPPPGAVQAAAVRGQTTITILTSGAAGSIYEEVVPPEPVGSLRTPDYPEVPLRAKFGLASIAVRVFVDASGRVTDIKDAPASPSSGGRYATEFRSAAENAIHQWKFQPAQHRQYKDGKDLNGDGKPDYMVVIAMEPVPVYFDVRFDFSIVNGRARVSSRQPH